MTLGCGWNPLDTSELALLGDLLFSRLVLIILSLLKYQKTIGHKTFFFFFIGVLILISCSWIPPPAEAVARRCSVKKVFLEILQNSQENISARVSFLIKLQSSACSFIRKETLAQMFYCEFCKVSKNTFSYRTHAVAVSPSILFLLLLLVPEFHAAAEEAAVDSHQAE